MTKQINVAQFIAQKIKASGKTYVQVAKEIGYETDRASLIEMIATGRSKLPLNKVRQFAESLNLNPAELLRMVLAEYSPTTLDAIEDITGRNLATGNPTEGLGAPPR